MMRPLLKRTSQQDRAKPITLSCREFNSASDGVCFVKQFLAVLAPQHQKENQVQSFTLTNFWITFLAFGNGAPDIFASLASVLNTKSPSAGLAFGALLGNYFSFYTG